MVLEPVDAALDRVALFVVGLVELRRPAAEGAKLAPVADPVRRNRDCRLDSASAQVGAVFSGVVCLISSDSVRAFTWSAEPQPGNSDRFQDRFELRGVTSLAGCDHHGQRLLSLLDRKMDFAGQAAARSSEPMVGRLGEDPAGGLLLEVPFFAAQRRAGGPGRPSSRR